MPAVSFGLCFLVELLLWRGVTIDWIVDEWVGCRIADFYPEKLALYNIGMALK